VSRETPGKKALILSEAALDALLAHDWPGNVRELENAIRPSRPRRFRSRPRASARSRSRRPPRWSARTAPATSASPTTSSATPSTSASAATCAPSWTRSRATRRRRPAASA
jgi:DNA-binding NtrC family response regulator